MLRPNQSDIVSDNTNQVVSDDNSTPEASDDNSRPKVYYHLLVKYQWGKKLRFRSRIQEVVEEFSYVASKPAFNFKQPTSSSSTPYENSTSTNMRPTFHQLTTSSTSFSSHDTMTGFDLL